MNAENQQSNRQALPESSAAGVLGGIVELRDGWRLENGMPCNCSRILRPDGVTAFYRYMETSKDEALLIAWAYQEGYKHGDTERQHKIKTILGLNAS